MTFKLHTILLILLAAACLWFAHGCAILKRGAWTGGGAAGGAAIGSMAGPAGTIGGAAVGGIAGQALGENDELRDGTLIGEGAAKVIYRDRVVDRFSIPWGWILIVGGAILFWLKGHHLWNALRERDLSKLSNILLPSWLQKSQPRR